MKKETYKVIAKKTGDPIVERKTCKRTGEDFPIYQSEIQMLDKLSPIINGQKYSLPTPDLSPKARQINRLVFRNERRFYKAKTVQGNIEISTIAPEMGLKIAGFKDYFEGDYESYPLNYSGDIKNDLIDLRKNSVFPSKLITNMENSDYCNQESDDKNCYLNAGGHYNENSMYNTYSLSGKRTVDNYRVIESENIYKSYNIFTSNKIFFSSRVENSHNVRFSQDIVGSNNILLSSLITNGNYVYKNKTYAKQEREEIFAKYKQKIKTQSGLLVVQKEYDDFIKTQYTKNLNNVRNENCIGNEISNSKNSFLSTSLEDGENVYYSNIVAYIKDSMDIESVGRAQKIYQCASSLRVNNSISCSHIFDSLSNGYYTAFSQNGENIFASLGLNHKKYTILNREYFKTDYYKIVDKIITDMKDQGLRGRFLMPELSPFPYNDTVAMDYFPVTENQLEILNPNDFISDAILDLGGEEKIKIKRRTRESEINIPQGLAKIYSKDMPDSIDDIDNEILQKIIICDRLNRPFRIIKPELDFHKRFGIALPKLHPDIRHIQKLSNKQSRNLILTQCSRCKERVLSTTYSKNILCEECYKKYIY